MNRLAVVVSAVAFLVATLPAWAEPELNVVPDKQPARPLRAYRIVCEVSWVGNPAEYAVLPADVESIDWGSVALSEMSATVRGNVNVVTQTVAITPNETGEFMTPGIRISFLSPENTTPELPGPPTHPTASEASPQLSAASFALRVRPDRTLAWLSGILGAFFFFLAVGWWFVRRRARRPVSPDATSPTPDRTTIQALLGAAQQHRIDGASYEFYQRLVQAAEELPGGIPHLDALKTRAQNAGYGGARPREDEMDADYRSIQRALEQHEEELSR